MGKYDFFKRGVKINPRSDAKLMIDTARNPNPQTVDRQTEI